MHANAIEPGGTVVPTLRYRDVAAAIDWLCDAFGFTAHHVVSGDDGAVRYAELTFGNGMIMLAPVEDSGLDKFMAQPADIGGTETQICYLFVADATAHCAQAREAGAEIVLDIEDVLSKGRGYSCRDLEGHIWNFGTYDPWRRQAAPAGEASGHAFGKSRGPRRLAAVAALFAAVIGSAMVAGWALGLTDVSHLELMTATSPGVAEAATHPHRAALEQVRDATDQLARERAAREAAERIAMEAQAQLAREHSAREGAERTAKLTGAPSARADTERALEDARQQLARERSALESAQRVAQEARERLSLAERASEAVQQELAAERKAREAAEAAGEHARLQLTKETAAKDAAEKAAKQAREEEKRERAAHKAPPRGRPTPVPINRSFINWDRPSS